MSEITKSTNVLVTTVMRLFDKVGVGSNFEELPEAIGIDEFRNNAGGSKYQCIIIDPLSGRILDILKDRERKVLIEYFKRFKNRDKVKYFITRYVETICRNSKDLFYGSKSSNR
nr:transposase [Thermoanaerobacter siderophilus]